MVAQNEDNEEVVAMEKKIVCYTQRKCKRVFKRYNEREREPVVLY